MSAFLDTVELHMFKRAVIIVCGELGFKELGDKLKTLGLKLLARRNKLVAVIFVKHHSRASASEGFAQLPAGGDLAVQSISLNCRACICRGVIRSFQKRIITSQLHVDVLLVARFLIPDYLTYENGDCTINVFILIAAFKHASSFRLVFRGFGKVVGEDLKPGGAISVT